MPTTLLMLPPQTPATRGWATRLKTALPELSVIVAETETEARQAVAHVEAAFGTIPDALLGEARRLRWLQAPQAAPPAGYYTAALIAHPVVVTNAGSKSCSTIHGASWPASLFATWWTRPAGSDRLTASAACGRAGDGVHCGPRVSQSRLDIAATRAYVPRASSPPGSHGRFVSATPAHSGDAFGEKGVMMQVTAVLIPPEADWRWRIVNYAGETIEESRRRFPTISRAVEEGTKRLRELDVDRSVPRVPYRTTSHLRGARPQSATRR
jgi:hypothetical protein